MVGGGIQSRGGNSSSGSISINPLFQLDFHTDFQREEINRVKTPVWQETNPFDLIHHDTVDIWKIMREIIKDSKFIPTLETVVDSTPSSVHPLLRKVV